MSAVPATDTVNRSARAICQELYEQARQEGYTALQARLIAGRMDHAALAGRGVRDTIAPRLSALDDPAGLPDIEIASERIAHAVRRREHIVTLCDHDADGVTASAVLCRALERMGADRLTAMNSHRLEEGYGVTEAFAHRVLKVAPRPTLAITADQGSTCHAGCAILRSGGVDVIVTDHHLLDVRLPAEAMAIVNPQRRGFTYPDKSIAGVMVAFLVMARVRQQLIGSGHLSRDFPAFTDLLDIVSAGTVADCVTLGASVNNRAVVRAGLQLIGSRRPRPCWQALCQQPIDSKALAFQVGPRLNAAGRLDDAAPGVALLGTDDHDSADRIATLLHHSNETRKQIQAEMVEVASVAAEKLSKLGVSGFVIPLHDGHPGIHGIVASRIAEAFRRPTVCFSPVVGREGLWTGSARTARGVHLKDALDEVQRRTGGVLQAYGGHAAAAGMKVRDEDLRAFTRAFDRVCREALQADPGQLYDELHDSELSLIKQSPEVLLTQFDELEPFGRGFPWPTFRLSGRITGVKRMGADGAHARLTVDTIGGDVVWFSAPKSLAPGHLFDSVVELAWNHWRGTRKPQFVVQQ